jgi:hypothetical protein
MDAYEAAALYRHKINNLVGEARVHFASKIVCREHAIIYADEIKAIPVPEIPGPDYGSILEEALQKLRLMVNNK